jgi:hypothetical protein
LNHDFSFVQLSVLRVATFVSLRAEPIRYLSPASHPQLVGDPFQAHGCLVLTRFVELCLKAIWPINGEFAMYVYLAK